jgi:hypothetical protein
MKILNADLEQLSKDNKCDEILDVVRFVGTVAPDYGGPENQAKLRAFVIFAMKNAKDEETRKSAADLFDELRK